MPLNNVDFSTFCNSELSWGQPVSFTGEYFDGKPECVLYDGREFGGISCQTVIGMENAHALFKPVVGGLITCIRLGTARIPKRFISGDIKINRFFEPVIGGYYCVQEERNEKTVGIISLVDDNFVSVSLI